MAGGRLALEVTPSTALWGSFVLSFFFVASLYLWKLAGYQDANRDDTGTIQRRFLSALLSCICSVVFLFALTSPAEDGKGFTVLELFGIQCDNIILACIQCLALTIILFVGPLVQHVVGVYEGSAELIDMDVGTWVALRNYVLAPFTEEFVFRACLVRLWVAAGFPKSVIIFVSPLCFAMAHAHHFIEHVKKTARKRTALLQVAFQVFYTSLFGMYSNFLLLRTGSTVALILTHSFCNHQGFPDVAFLVSKRHPLHPHRLWLGMLYLSGVVSFCYCINPLTSGFSSSFDTA